MKENKINGQNPEVINPDERKNPLEWAVFFVSAVIVVVTLGYLSWQALTFEETAPELQVKLYIDPTDAEPYRYRFELQNSGGETASDIFIEIKASTNDNKSETIELELPFVPRLSTRDGWVNLSKIYGPHDTLMAKVVSYQTP